MRRRFTLLLLALGMMAGGTPVRAFHSQGVGNCNGCHVMHDDPSTGIGPAQPSLLREGNATDVCLRCHETGHGNSWGSNLLLPGPVYGGGSFIFLLEQNLNDGPDGLTAPIPGWAAGHNVVSFARGTVPDPDSSTSPGGTYPSAHLTCTSCHDPHDKGGNYRMLYGSNSPPSLSDGYDFTFTAPAPTAVGIDVDGPAESDSNHNAYQSGMSQWCGNCHDRYHDAVGSQNLGHPIDEPLGGEEQGNYNTYRGTGYYDGDPNLSYLPMVPLEHPTFTSTSRGPVPSGARVTCVSCHRAHASSGPRSGRWDFNIDTWFDEGRLSGSWPIPNPYPNTAGPTQKQLCEKCHGASVPNTAPSPTPSPGDPTIFGR